MLFIVEEKPVLKAVHLLVECPTQNHGELVTLPLSIVHQLNSTKLSKEHFTYCNVSPVLYGHFFSQKHVHDNGGVFGQRCFTQFYELSASHGVVLSLAVCNRYSDHL